MSSDFSRSPEEVFEYSDPEEGFKGWLAIDRRVHRMCAGGMRVQKGLSREHLIDMAHNMTRKMKIADLRVDGAKCGIDYDPTSPGKQAAVSRFIKAIEPYIRTVYSMGPDLNIDMNELEAAAADHNIPSVKMAIAKAQDWDLEYFLERSIILNTEIDGFSLGRLRAGYGVAAAALAILEYINIEPANATISVQGFGNLAKAAIYGLDKAGCRIVAIADKERCLCNDAGLDIDEFLKCGDNLLPDLDRVVSYKSHEIFNCKCNIIIPAALENTITPNIAEKLPVNAVVPGANLAVTAESDTILAERDIPLVPDFLAGCGGSLSMEGLYGPDQHPSPQEVLDHVRNKMQVLVKQVMKRCVKDGCTPTEAALKICNERVDHPGSRPYGKPS
jgi:glutamate dehydrogenase (NAD(P)+)